MVQKKRLMVLKTTKQKIKMYKYVLPHKFQPIRPLQDLEKWVDPMLKIFQPLSPQLL